MKELNETQLFILGAVKDHPKDLVQHTKKKFNVSVQAIQKQIARLVKDHKLIKTGKTRNVVYSLPRDINSKISERMSSTSAERQGLLKGTVIAEHTWQFSITKDLNEQELWDETLKKRLKGIPENIFDIAEYGFTEMVNNAKDHANADQLNIGYKISGEELEITVQDNGIGIFKKVKESLNLPNFREAILDLSKGKFTTDHSKHTGEGIFFSSRVFDNYCIFANGLLYKRINTLADEDWLVGEEEGATIGTLVQMEITLDSTRTREEVFRRFTSAEDYSFSKTHVAVELGKVEGESYVSRSQAKRILAGLEKFRFIVLNFKRVKSVGQGFVDEVFRVFTNAHPEIKIDYVNANDSVEFMIKRGLQ